MNYETEMLSVELDRSLMLRAVSNLVSNAIAHTPRGGTVTLAAAYEDTLIRIEVSDTGVGIPTEALPRVFDRFPASIHRAPRRRAVQAWVWRLCRAF